MHAQKQLEEISTLPSRFPIWTNEPGAKFLRKAWILEIIGTVLDTHIFTTCIFDKPESDRELTSILRQEATANPRKETLLRGLLLDLHVHDRNIQFVNRIASDISYRLNSLLIDQKQWDLKASLEKLFQHAMEVWTLIQGQFTRFDAIKQRDDPSHSPQYDPISAWLKLKQKNTDSLGWEQVDRRASSTDSIAFVLFPRILDLKTEHSVLFQGCVILKSQIPVNKREGTQSNTSSPQSERSGRAGLLPLRTAAINGGSSSEKLFLG